MPESHLMKDSMPNNILEAYKPAQMCPPLIHTGPALRLDIVSHSVYHMVILAKPSNNRKS